MRTHYEVMGIGRCFVVDELKARYRELTREMHPDRLGGTPEANKAFAEVTFAYSQLSDRKLKQLYDAMLDLTTAPCSACTGSGVTWKQRGFVDRTKHVCATCMGCGRVETAESVARKFRVKHGKGKQ